MKTVLLIITMLFIVSCSNETEAEYFNPKYEIKVNFKTKEAWQSGRKLQNATQVENEICENIIKNKMLPANTKFSELCSGGNDKRLNFAHVIISGSVNGYFVISYDENRMISHKLQSFDSAKCGLFWIIEK